MFAIFPNFFFVTSLYVALGEYDEMNSYLYHTKECYADFMMISILHLPPGISFFA